MLQAVREFLLAVQFFTRIPVTGPLAEWVGFSPAMLRASAGHFPGVGVLVGLVAAGVYALLMALLPDAALSPVVAAVLSTVATALLTGGFHEDGLADLTDGLGGSSDKARALEIMKDSRVGAFGAMALVLALGAKIALLGLLGSVEGTPNGWLDGPWLESFFKAPVSGSALTGWYACGALLAGHVVSRTLPLLLIAWLPHVGDAATSKSKPLADKISLNSLLTAFLWCFSALVTVSIAFSAINLIVACSFAVLALLWVGRLLQRRLQGFTGDALGAAQQVCELAFYLGLAVSL